MSLATADAPGTCSADIARLFPLPLSTIEAFMLADATVDYPMMCDLALHFSGRIDRALFDIAFSVAMSRAPLFRSVIEVDAKRGPHWVLTDRQPTVEWAELGTPYGEDYDSFTDLTCELPLRVYVRAGEEHSTIELHFHHASSDGLGGVAFAEDFLAAYANASAEGPPVELRPLEPERLLQRNRASAEPIRGLRGIVDALVGMREGLRFFWQRPLPLAPRPRELTQPSSQPSSKTDRVRQQRGYIHQLCPDGVAAGLRSVASKSNATVNDVLLRDLYLTLAAWNKNFGRRQLRILMPQNLREPADGKMPATNRIGFAFLTRRADLVRHPQKLLASLQVETEAIVQGQLSRYFLDGLATMHSTGLLKRMLNSSMCFSSAVLTNLGYPQRRFVVKLPRSGTGLVVGNLLFTGLTGTPPLRPQTTAAFCIFGQGQTFSVNLKCDSYSFTREETESLLASYLTQLAATARGETDG